MSVVDNYTSPSSQLPAPNSQPDPRSPIGQKAAQSSPRRAKRSEREQQQHHHLPKQKRQQQQRRQQKQHRHTDPQRVYSHSQSQTDRAGIKTRSPGLEPIQSIGTETLTRTHTHTRGVRKKKNNKIKSKQPIYSTIQFFRRLIPRASAIYIHTPEPGPSGSRGLAR